MTNLTLTQIKSFKETCRKHEQNCLAIETLAKNGTDLKDLLPLIEQLHEQSEEMHNLTLGF